MQHRLHIGALTHDLVVREPGESPSGHLDGVLPFVVHVPLLGAMVLTTVALHCKLAFAVLEPLPLSTLDVPLTVNCKSPNGVVCPVVRIKVVLGLLPNVSVVGRPETITPAGRSPVVLIDMGCPAAPAEPLTAATETAYVCEAGDPRRIALAGDVTVIVKSNTFTVTWAVEAHPLLLVTFTS